MVGQGGASFGSASLFLLAFLTSAEVSVAARPPAPAGRVDLRKYFQHPEASPDRAALKKRLSRLSVSKLLSLLRGIEPLGPRPAGLSRFETPEGAYLVIAPKGYTPKKSYPLHIELHGHGSAQTGHTACERYWQGEPAAAGILLACPDLRDRWTTPRAERLLIATYKDVQQRYNVATHRVTLGGFSGGGIGTWMMGPEYPDFFAALGPRAGIPPRADEVMANLNGLPVYLVHGRGDPTIPVSNSRRAAEVMKRLGVEHIYREEAGGHEFFGRLNTAIVRWLLTKSRPSRRAFRYRGRLGGERRIVHFLELRGTGVVTVNARIEKRRRVVLSFDPPGVATEVRLHLNRKLVDMARKNVVVEIKGRGTRTYPLKETVAEVLDSYDVTRDLRRVYPAGVTIRLSGKSP